MGTTKLCKNGTNFKRLTDRKRRFVSEYLLDYNAKAAAIRAGYAKKSAHVMGSRLLNESAIAHAIGKAERITQEHFEATREEILEQLSYCATRNATDFVDKDGNIIQNIHDLPKRAQNAIDGIEETESYDKDGNLIAVKRKLIRVSKLGAIDLAMKNKGMFAAEKVETRITVDWDSLPRPDTQDRIAQRLEREEVIDIPLLKNEKE